MTLYTIEGRSLVGTLDEIIAVLFVVGLVAGVITAVRHSLVELEATRAQTLGVVSHEVKNHLTGVIGASPVQRFAVQVCVFEGDVGEFDHERQEPVEAYEPV